MSVTAPRFRMKPKPKKAKGPAETAISPSHGPASSSQEVAMNSNDDSTTMAQGASAPLYSIDDLINDTSRLHDLLEVTCSVLIAMDYGTGKDRNRDLDRVASLASIAREMALRMSDTVSENYVQLVSREVAA